MATHLSRLQREHAPKLDQAESIALGKATRATLPRSAQAAYTSGSRDPLAILAEQNATRVESLVPLRMGRMLASPFTFYRGTAAIMAQDLARGPSTGFNVISCGDAHISNFGLFASPQRSLVFDLNDFDEAGPAPWEWDVKRFVTSVVIGARDAGYSDKDTRTTALEAARSYRRSLLRLMTLTSLERYYYRLDTDTPEMRHTTIRSSVVKFPTDKNSAHGDKTAKNKKKKKKASKKANARGRAQHHSAGRSNEASKPSDSAKKAAPGSAISSAANAPSTALSARTGLSAQYGLSAQSGLSAQYGLSAQSGLTDEAQRVIAKVTGQARKRTSEAYLEKISTSAPDGTRLIIENPPILTHVPETDEIQLERLFERYRGTVTPDIAQFLTQFQLTDLAMRVVGVGSVGTRCYILILTGPQKESLVLQVKEAQVSVLENYGGIKPDDHENNPATPSNRAKEGHRVVNNQRILQTVSDPFLGYLRFNGHDYYVRQFRDMKGSFDTSDLKLPEFMTYVDACGIMLARAHAQSATAPVIAGYLGKSDTFDNAVVDWAFAYAEQSLTDYRKLQAAVAAGEIEALIEV